MNDRRYEYTKQNVILLILKNKEGKVLLVKQPEDWEWMPGRWGLPGGKPYERESLLDALDRKTKQELGKKIKPDSLIEIEELLIEGKTVIMYIVAKQGTKSFSPKGEMAGYKWVGLEEITAMELSEFKEFYFKALLTEYLSGNKRNFPISLVKSRKYFKISEKKDYQRWFKTTPHKNFDIKKVKDYQVWEKDKGGK